MIEMLAILAVFGILSVAALSGYQKVMSKLNLKNSISAVVDILNEWAQLTISGKNISGDAEGWGVLSYVYKNGCEKAYTALPRVNQRYQVCHIPLGEFYLKKYFHANLDTLLIYVTLFDQDTSVCEEFLSQNWRDTVPDRMRDTFAIWIISNKESKMVYAPGSNVKPNMTQITRACQTVCPSNSEYCTIVFDIGAYPRY